MPFLGLLPYRAIMQRFASFQGLYGMPNLGFSRGRDCPIVQTAQVVEKTLGFAFLVAVAGAADSTIFRPGANNSADYYLVSKYP